MECEAYVPIGLNTGSHCYNVESGGFSKSRFLRSSRLNSSHHPSTNPPCQFPQKPESQSRHQAFQRTSGRNTHHRTEGEHRVAVLRTERARLGSEIDHDNIRLSDHPFSNYP